MKKWMVAAAAMILAPWMVSLFWMQAAGASVKLKDVSETSGETSFTSSAENGEEAAREVFGTEISDSGRRIILERDGVSTYMKLEDYLPGVMVCQIDTSYHEEALKCQAVIARTYLYRLMDGRREIYEEELDLDYLGEGNGFSWEEMPGISPEKREQLATGLKRCEEAARATFGVVMKYEERYLLPLFHGVSAGRTRTGWEDYPYLQSVESRWDQEADGYLQQFSWSGEEFAAQISQMEEGQKIGADELKNQIQTVKKDDAGYMEQIKIGGKTFDGEAVSCALGLPSSCFSVEEEAGRIIITTKGIGHGYGLSQAGADAQAREGWGYEEILQYYYKNILLTSE